MCPGGSGSAGLRAAVASPHPAPRERHAKACPTPFVIPPPRTAPSPAPLHSAHRGHYVGVHASGFRDFLLKPELLRAIVDCGFEHPSEGTCGEAADLLACF